MSALLERFSAIVGTSHVLTGDDTAPWRMDWTGKYPSAPQAVLRPGSTQEVSRILALAHADRVAIVPVGGNTGITGATVADGALALSLGRMNRIREIRPEGRVAVVEAGVVLAALHDAAAEHDLIFPLTFGARGSATIGGALSTNAGGSNVLRYGNTRELCLGLEVVMADGRVMDTMTALHKDNSGLNLRQLMIGAEGTLGVVTAAVLKLRPKPRAYATAMLAVPTFADALALLNRLQDLTGGQVEAFEFMPRAYIDGHLALIAGARPPFAEAHDINVLIEIGATAPRDATPDATGAVPIVTLLENALGDMLASGTLLDAVVARSDAQRREMWARREAAAEITYARKPIVDTDICVPLDAVEGFLADALARVRHLDPGAQEMVVAHLGDGNVHYSIYPGRDDPALSAAILEAIEDAVAAQGGSFSAEHGIGLSKRGTMARRKDPTALAAMRAIKAALDPRGILNPGKVYPD